MMFTFQFYFNLFCLIVQTLLFDCALFLTHLSSPQQVPPLKLKFIFSANQSYCFMSFQQFLTTLEQKIISEIICLITQIIITIHTATNLSKNKECFPVKQLSPLLSTVALYSFLLLNSISFIARILEQRFDYYDPNYQNPDLNCGQCRLYNHPQMIVLAILYNGLRQLPLIIFIVKTYRVCLCYWIKYDQQLSDRTIALFSNQKKMLILCGVMTGVFTLIVFLFFGQGNPHSGTLIFEFFCPKQSSIYDWIMIILRFGFMAFVFVISIYTYNELDFKWFLLLVFTLTNTEVVLRLFLALQKITKTTYHEFYYHSFIMNLFGTLIMFYYSTIKEQRNKPLSIPILQSFKAFLQNSLGFSVLTLYSKYLDKEKKTKQYFQTFEACIQIDEIMMLAYDNQSRIKDVDIPRIIQILKNVRELNELENKQKLIEKCRKKQLNAADLRYVDKKLSQFCEENIFWEWRQTQSSKYLENEFRNNGVINLRMSNLGIGIQS